MATQPLPTERRTEKLDVRVSPSAKAMLLAVALATHRSMSDFVMESALFRAKETLAERRVFWLDGRNGLPFRLRSMHRLIPCPVCKRSSMSPDFFDSDPGQ
jgi:uncharacterized protein (DUF1778 family)